MSNRLPEPWQAQAEKLDDEQKKRKLEFKAVLSQLNLGDWAHIHVSPRPKPKVPEAKMSDITRPELDAKLETIEAKMDARIARIETSVEGFLGEASKLRAELSHAKWWAIGTAVAVLTVFAGFLQFGLQSQKDENARFAGYMREDVKVISTEAREISKTLGELRIQLERQPSSQDQ